MEQGTQQQQQQAANDADLGYEVHQPSLQSASSSPSPSLQTDEKGQTFRKRRLSLTNLKQQQQQQQQQPPTNGNSGGASAQDNEVAGETAAQHEQGTAAAHEAPAADQTSVASTGGPEDEKAQTFRKRRLSLTHKREEPSAEGDAASATPAKQGDAVEPSPNRRRRFSDASLSSVISDAGYGNRPLKSRTVHASELLSQPPPSPAVNLRLYQASAPPQQRPMMDPIDATGPVPLPRWKKRHTRNMNEDERKLPFPRDIVGTFSCHGVEPIYDSDDGMMQDDYDDDEDAEWGALGQKDRLTTAAKINQDRGGVAFPYGNCSRTALFAVYDGHGQGGESVAQFALHEVQRRLEKHSEFDSDVEKAFKETFVGVDEALEKEVLIEPRYAGTTACVVLLREDTLIVSNAGDSRAVLARKIEGSATVPTAAGTTAAASDDNGSNGTATTQQQQQQQQVKFQAVNISTDQNPDLPAEQARIERMGGFVSPPPEPGLSARVWLDSTCTQIGLAMARSIGDHAVKPIGVIAEPVVTQHKIHPDDEFMILATDGVWEFISSEEAVKVVSDNMHLGATKACQCLIEAAAARWHDEEGDYRDDITALVIRLQRLWDAETGKTKRKRETT